MTDRLTVLMGDRIAGSLTRLANAHLRFDYDERYAHDSSATPISVSMPLQIASHDHDRVWPWLWGLLPDNQDVIDRWARRFQVSRSSPFGLLGTPVGEDCSGAVRFCTPDRVPELMARPGTIEWLTESDVAQRLRQLMADRTAWLGTTFTGQFSLAGAQAKTALLLQDGRWGLPGGATATSHILKPGIAGLDDQDIDEHLCLDAARRVGLRVAHSTIMTFEDIHALVLERYDRVVREGTQLRVHQEDVCQALAVHPDRKYQREGGPAPGRIAELLRAVMPPQVADDAVGRFADALIWNWLIGGTDAHAKNYALLLAGPQVRLAPLYDIASALPYGVHERRLRSAMKVGGTYDMRPARNFWPAAAAELGVDPSALVQRVRELAAVAPDAFQEAADTDVVRRLGRDLPAALVDLVAGRAARCAAVVD